MKTETGTPDSTTNDSNGVLITGGYGYDKGTRYSAEIFLPNSPGKPCILPNLPEPYYGHTQDGSMICGGVKTQYTCRQWNFDEGKFPDKPNHQFRPGRYRLVSWTPVSEKETFLIGGGSSKPKSGAHNSTNTLTPGVFMGRKGFDLKNQYILYGACSIADPETDTVIITGGNAFDQPRFKLTSLYNEDGFIENFGNLTHRREFHGCTSYVANKKRVGN